MADPWIAQAIAHGAGLAQQAPASSSPVMPVQGPLRVMHAVGEAVHTALPDGRPLLSYRYGDDFHMPYWHPVHTPSGRQIGIFSPHDHPWHRGLWMVWKYVNKVNFWEGPFDAHPDRGYGLQRQRTIEILPVAGDRVRVAGIIDWVTSRGQHFLEERRSWTVAMPQPEAGWYTIDLAFAFRAVTSPLLIESISIKQVSWGGYGGFGFRAGRDMTGHRAGLRNAAGAVGDEAVHGQKADWCAYCGPLDGTLTREWAGFAVLGHPSNPVHPVPFHASSEGIAYVGTAPTRYAPLRIPRRRPLTFRHRVVVHDGRTDEALIQRLYEAFAEEGTA